MADKELLIPEECFEEDFQNAVGNASESPRLRLVCKQMWLLGGIRMAEVLEKAFAVEEAREGE